MINSRLAVVGAAVALMMAPQMALSAPQTPNSVLIEDLDCLLTVNGSTDAYEGCALAGVVGEDGMMGVGFALDPQRSIIFAGVQQDAKTVKVIGMSINDGQPVPARGVCTSSPGRMKCSVYVGNGTVTVEAYRPGL